MRWVNSEKTAYYDDEHITIRSTVGKHTLFSGTIKGLKFSKTESLSS